MNGEQAAGRYQKQRRWQGGRGDNLELMLITGSKDTNLEQQLFQHWTATWLGKVGMQKN